MRIDTLKIRRFAAIVAAMALIALPGAADQGTWGLDKAHTEINFSVKHFFTPVSGSFQEYDADLFFDPDNPERSQLEVRIPVTSIDTGNTRRDDHLRSADWVEADKHPTITFVSKSVRKKGKDKLIARGGSAGGLLMGAVTNMRPELFEGVVAAVPFVDVMTTMLDPDIPLTSGEWDEWGDPNDKESYDYMLSYSPYDNVEAKDYPNLLVTTGLHDSQVQYWEPAKWVAKLRAAKTDSNRLLLKTDMDAGHGGVSGRYRKYRETALQYAFLLREAGRA